VQRLQQLHRVLSEYPGDVSFQILFEGQDTRRLLSGERLRVHWAPGLEEAVETLLGPGSLLKLSSDD
jgi:hypothetical protein